MTDYVTVAGFVAFDPRPRDAGGKAVRDVMIQNIGSRKDFNITIWPEKAHVEINKGDFIVVNGAYSTRVTQNKEGAAVTYHNVSASRLVRFPGEADGVGAASVLSSVTVPADDDEDFFS